MVDFDPMESMSDIYGSINTRGSTKAMEDQLNLIDRSSEL